MKKYALVAAILLAAPLFAFCGGSSDDSQTADPTSTATAPLDADTATPEDGADDPDPTAPDATATGAAAPSAAPVASPIVGITIQRGGSRYRVNAIIDDYPATESYKPDEGNRFFVFDVTQTGVEEGDEYGPHRFRVRTTDGMLWDCLSFGGPDVPFAFGAMRAGQRVRGLVNCEIAEDAEAAFIIVSFAPGTPAAVLADFTLGTESADPYPTGEPVAGPALGESTEASGSRFTVNAIDDDYSGGAAGPRPGNRLVAFELTHERVADSDSEAFINFYLQTTDDFFSQCTAFDRPDPRFPTDALASGQEANGWVGCEIREDGVVAAIWVAPEFNAPATIIAVP